MAAVRETRKEELREETRGEACSADQADRPVVEAEARADLGQQRETEP